MGPQQVIAWIQAGELLLSAGVTTVNAIKGLIQSQHPETSDADLNAILDAIVSGASRHRGLALGDAG